MAGDNLRRDADFSLVKSACHVHIIFESGEVGSCGVTTRNTQTPSRLRSSWFLELVGAMIIAGTVPASAKEEIQDAHLMDKLCLGDMTRRGFFISRNNPKRMASPWSGGDKDV